ncbi:MAG TPA: hypothetical protein VHP36_01155 [Chitinispirillaceae bacterium]|nr:hypothetical protein [Chitinispirillaceae bacterium]
MRSTKEVFDSHLLYTLDWDIDTDIEINYAADCFLLSSYGAYYGSEGIRKAFSVLESQIPEADILYSNKTVHNDIAFLEWQAESDDAFIDDGADTFIIRNGKIVSQTMHYTIRSRGQ